MARPRGPEQRAPVKMRVNVGLMERLEALAKDHGCSVPKLLSRIMEEAVAELLYPVLKQLRYRRNELPVWNWIFRKVRSVSASFRRKLTDS